MRKVKSKNLIHYDQKSNVLYIGVKKGIEEEFVEISPGVNVEVDSQGKVIGIEILNASRVLQPIVKPFQKQILEPAAR